MITVILLLLTLGSGVRSEDQTDPYEQSNDTLARNVKLYNEVARSAIHSYILRIKQLIKMDRSYQRPMSMKDIRERNAENGIPRRRFHPRSRLPRELDWRKMGFVTPAWNQEKCASCYAFSIAASVQAQVFIKKGKIEPLSTQQIVDCSYPQGNRGCRGGTFKNTLHYVKRHGLMTDEEYPYAGNQSLCRYKTQNVSVKIKYWGVLPAGDEDALKMAVVNFGPIPVSINSKPDSFRLYEKGIYDDPDCTAQSVNHAVLLVGYTEEAWIIKNWWTDQWGEDGYMYLKRGKNMCGISNYAVYIKV